MTREQLDALEALYKKVPVIKAMPCDVVEPYTFKFLMDAHFSFSKLIAAARRALELEESTMSLVRILERILDDIPARRDWLDPDLERVARQVIQNARRGK